MRSNKHTTQKLVWAVMDFIKGFSSRDKRVFGNTAAYFLGPRSCDPTAAQIIVTLYDNVLMQIVTNEETLMVEEVWIHSGYYYDTYGNPTSLTRERLNGLLDALGDHEIIPKHVRVIYDSEDEMCYLNHETGRAVLNRDYCNVIGIKPNPTDITFIPVDKAPGYAELFCVPA